MDVVFSFLGLLCLSPVLLVFMFLIYRQDGRSPFFIAPRMGKNEIPFHMVKLRSMTIGADKSGVDSTSSGDMRITKIGHMIRRYKLDELMQLWNVFLGDMSLVGPRPNVQRDTDLYTVQEKRLLTVKPGITDFSSIVFSDEGSILEGKEDPDLAYNQLIRPWKSRLGLIYIDNRSFSLDLQLILYTVVAIVSKEKALMWVVSTLERLNVEEKVIAVTRRKDKLTPFYPPGSSEIVTTRNVADTK